MRGSGPCCAGLYTSKAPAGSGPAAVQGCTGRPGAADQGDGARERSGRDGARAWSGRAGARERSGRDGRGRGHGAGGRRRDAGAARERGRHGSGGGGNALPRRHPRGADPGIPTGTLPHAAPRLTGTLPPAHAAPRLWKAADQLRERRPRVE